MDFMGQIKVIFKQFVRCGKILAYLPTNTM